MNTNPVSDKVLSLAGFNLNLLTTFCLVYSTRSITEVSEILDVTPPSVSHALRKLRLHFQDPLFIRHGNSIAPTVFADDLYIRLKNNLEIMSDAIIRRNLTNSRETIVIYSSFSSSAHDFSTALKKIKSEGLNFKLKYIEKNLGVPDAVGLLNLRKADIVFSAAPVVSSNLISVKYGELSVVLACRMDNPLQKTPIRPEQLKSIDMAGHLIADDMIHYKKQNMLKDLQNPRFSFETNSLLTLLTVLSETDSVGFISEDAFNRYHHVFRLRKQPLQISLPGVGVYVTYRKELEKKNEFMHLLDAILTGK